MQDAAPQVSLINLESPNLEQEAVKFEFYAILLIETAGPVAIVADVSITIIPTLRWCFLHPVRFSA